MSECFFYALQGDADRMMAALPTHQRTSRHRGTGDEHSSVRVSVNVQDAHGRTPLHFAVLGRAAACVTALLDKKAKVSLTDDQGFTRLLFALFSFTTPPLSSFGVTFSPAHSLPLQHTQPCIMQ